MPDTDDIDGVLLDLLAQVQRSLAPADLDRIEQMIRDGRHRDAVETVCRLSAAGNQPLPLPARALVFKLCDRLGMQPDTLGLLD